MLSGGAPAAKPLCEARLRGKCARWSNLACRPPSRVVVLAVNGASFAVFATKVAGRWADGEAMIVRNLIAIALTVLTACAPRAVSAQQTETLDQALCRMIEGAATTHRVPVDFFTRLIWQESSFRPGVVSRAGAQGAAQF